MENWQLALVILAAVLIGAAIPVLIALSLALFRAGKEITAIGKQLRPTLSHVQIISERVETLSRGLAGGEKNIADLLAAMGELAQGLERNMKIVNVASAIVASVAPAVAAFVTTMRHSNEPEEPHANNPCARHGEEQPTASSFAAKKPTEEPSNG